MKRNVAKTSHAKGLALLLAAGMLVSQMSGVSADAKAKKPKLSRTKVSVTVGTTKRVTVKNAKKVILDVSKEFEKWTGRHYDLFEEYKLDDAEIAVVCMNSTAGTTKAVVDKLREQGIKAGLLKIRVYRPFPGEEVAKALSHLKAIAVLDKSDSLNAIGGALFEDVVSSMYVAKQNVPVVNYVYGIGGRDTTEKEINSVYTDLVEIAKNGKVEDPYRYLGLRKEAK